MFGFDELYLVLAIILGRVEASIWCWYRIQKSTLNISLPYQPLVGLFFVFLYSFEDELSDNIDGILTVQGFKFCGECLLGEECWGLLIAPPPFRGWQYQGWFPILDRHSPHCELSFPLRLCSPVDIRYF